MNNLGMLKIKYSFRCHEDPVFGDVSHKNSHPSLPIGPVLHWIMTIIIQLTSCKPRWLWKQPIVDLDSEYSSIIMSGSRFVGRPPEESYIKG